MEKPMIFCGVDKGDTRLTTPEYLSNTFYNTISDMACNRNELDSGRKERRNELCQKYY